LDSRHGKIDTGSIGHKTQKDTRGKYWTQETERETRVTLDTRHRKIDTGNIGHKTQKDRHGQHWTQDTEIFLCLGSNVTRVYLSVSCVQCYPCLSFCVLSPMIPVSIFLCLVSNATRVYLSVSCVQCYPCLSFCVLCPMLPVSIFLCLVPNVSRVYLSVSCVHCFSCLFTDSYTREALGTSHRTIDTDNSGHKTQKDRHG
jgi:hypothetical protein